MDITPVIPDGYAGLIKRLTHSVCKHMSYITQDDYQRHPEVRFCHECSLIVHEELEKTQGAGTVTPPTISALPHQNLLCLSSSRFAFSFMKPLLRRDKRVDGPGQPNREA